ncbi:MAG: hypothetical protein KatS3mg081_0333 [Gemmatimonadales bacterium]|nr:MAG: hypothetical protein KatS3mg081_0333 [Gemmatimonadales bacterium]
MWTVLESLILTAFAKQRGVISVIHLLAVGTARRSPSKSGRIVDPTGEQIDTVKETRDRVVSVIVFLSVVGAACLSAVNVRTLLLRSSTRPLRVVRGWTSYAAVGSRVGPYRAPVTVVVFFDYQCPFSRKLYLALEELRMLLHANVAFVWRHFPLEGHRLAREAAVASACADLLGEFEDFHRILFGGTAAFGKKSWGEFALQAGINDTVRYNECLSGGAGEEAVARDIAAGRRLGVRGTPTFLINGEVFAGAGHDLVHLAGRRVRDVGRRR